MFNLESSTGRTIAHAAVADLRARMRGAVLTQADEGYDSARRIWNAMIDRRPGLIAQCISREDVQAALTFAREHDLILSIRGGGHNITGLALCERPFGREGIMRVKSLDLIRGFVERASCWSSRRWNTEAPVRRTSLLIFRYAPASRLHALGQRLE